MGWIYRAHACVKPASTNASPIIWGSIWECDTCGKQWSYTILGWVLRENGAKK